MLRRDRSGTIGAITLSAANVTYSNLSTYLLLGGASLLLIGLVLRFAPSTITWIGRLPGDITFRTGSVSFYFPLSTLIVINLILFVLSSLLSK